MEEFDPKIFDQYAKLPILTLVVTGRTGSDFFQSLLDGHPEIAQVAGNWDFHMFWEEAHCKEDLDDLIWEFIWFRWRTRSLLFKFESAYDKQERLDCMGPEQNESYSISREKFHSYCKQALEGKELNSHNFFIAVHLAYEFAKGNDPSKTKLLLYHIHHIERLARFKRYIPKFEVLCTIRDPRSTLISGMENWKRYNPETFMARRYCFLLDRILSEAQAIHQYTDKVKTLKLENLHLKRFQVFKEICNQYGIEYRDSLFVSTFNGKLWWGDRVSVSPINGFRDKIDDNLKWPGRFFKIERWILESVLEDRLQANDYPMIQDRIQRKIISLCTPILVWLPFKYEITIFKHHWPNKKTWLQKLRFMASTTINYISRVKLILSHRKLKLSGKQIITDGYALDASDG